MLSLFLTFSSIFFFTPPPPSSSSLSSPLLSVRRFGSAVRRVFSRHLVPSKRFRMTAVGASSPSHRPIDPKLIPLQRRHRKIALSSLSPIPHVRDSSLGRPEAKTRNPRSGSVGLDRLSIEVPFNDGNYTPNDGHHQHRELSVGGRTQSPDYDPRSR